jgi:hypothetical protein
VTAAIDLEVITEKWLRVCGQCDAGVIGSPCTHPDEDYRPVIAGLIAEVARLRDREVSGDDARCGIEGCPCMHAGAP